MAEAIAETLSGRHGGDRKSDQAGNISHLIEIGRNKDIAAAKAGLGSGKTLEAAQKVVKDGAPIIFPTEISSASLQHFRLYGTNTTLNCMYIHHKDHTK